MALSEVGDFRTAFYDNALGRAKSFGGPCGKAQKN